MKEIPSGYEIHKALKEHKEGINVNQDIALKELLERTGKPSSVSSVEALSQVAPQIESIPGFKTKPELIKVGETAEVIKNIITVFEGEELPPDSLLDHALQQLGRTHYAQLKEDVQLMQTRLEFYRDIATGEIKVENLRGFLQVEEKKTQQASKVISPDFRKKD